MRSSRFYVLVTNHWPRIAAALVMVLGLLEFVVGGLTADSRLESYCFAWAVATGAIWFLFEKAEVAISTGVKEKVVGIAQHDLRSSVSAIPEQFTVLFDRVFGEAHLTWRCFRRSCVASVVSVGIIAAIIGPRLDLIGDVRDLPAHLILLAIAVPMVANLVPDYISLLETRLVLRWAASKRWLALPVLVDLALTFGIAYAVWWVGAFGVGFDIIQEPDSPGVIQSHRFNSLLLLTGIGYYSTFFTSVWLWLYAASVLLSRILLRMNSGVGFLLRVTDVERQPFRSMGFVSVIIVSGVFLLGLPFVLL